MQGAQVRVYPARSDTTASAQHGAFTDSLGATRIDSLLPGSYTLHFARIGYAAHTVALDLRAGCSPVVEVYLRQMTTCLVTCTHTEVPAHAIITTCARGGD